MVQFRRKRAHHRRCLDVYERLIDRRDEKTVNGSKLKLGSRLKSRSVVKYNSSTKD